VGVGFHFLGHLRDEGNAKAETLFRGQANIANDLHDVKGGVKFFVHGYGSG
jgi:hypothetical protein